MDCFNTAFKLHHRLNEPVANKLILSPSIWLYDHQILCVLSYLKKTLLKARALSKSIVTWLWADQGTIAAEGAKFTGNIQSK